MGITLKQSKLQEVRQDSVACKCLREKICPMTSAHVGLFRQRYKHYVHSFPTKNSYAIRVRSLSGKGSFTLNKLLILKVQ